MCDMCRVHTSHLPRRHPHHAARTLHSRTDEGPAAPRPPRTQRVRARPTGQRDAGRVLHQRHPAPGGGQGQGPATTTTTTPLPQTLWRLNQTKTKLQLYNMNDMISVKKNNVLTIYFDYHEKENGYIFVH